MEIQCVRPVYKVIHDSFPKHTNSVGLIPHFSICAKSFSASTRKQVAGGKCTQARLSNTQIVDSLSPMVV